MERASRKPQEREKPAAGAGDRGQRPRPNPARQQPYSELPTSENPDSARESGQPERIILTKKTENGLGQVLGGTSPSAPKENQPSVLDSNTENALVAECSPTGKVRVPPSTYPWATLPGEAPAHPACGTVRHAIACPRGAQDLAAPNGQRTLDGHEHTREIHRNDCGRPACSHTYCKVRWRTKAAARAAERLHNFERTIREHGGRVGRPKHCVVSLTDAESIATMNQGPDGIERLRRRLFKELRNSGAYGGACIVHHLRTELKHQRGAQRYHAGQNYVSLHFHFILYGWLEDSRAFHKRTGWILHNIGIRESPDGVIAYLLDHALVMPGRKQTITWFGELSYNRMRRTHTEKELEPAACPCGNQLYRYETDPRTGDIDWRYPHDPIIRIHRRRHYHLRALDPTTASATT